MAWWSLCTDDFSTPSPTPNPIASDGLMLPMLSCSVQKRSHDRQRRKVLGPSNPSLQQVVGSSLMLSRMHRFGGGLNMTLEHDHLESRIEPSWEERKMGFRTTILFFTISFFAVPFSSKDPKTLTTKASSQSL